MRPGSKHQRGTAEYEANEGLPAGVRFAGEERAVRQTEIERVIKLQSCKSSQKASSCLPQKGQPRVKHKKSKQPQKSTTRKLQSVSRKLDMGNRKQKRPRSTSSCTHKSLRAGLHYSPNVSGDALDIFDAEIGQVCRSMSLRWRCCSRLALPWCLLGLGRLLWWSWGLLTATVLMTCIRPAC